MKLDNVSAEAKDLIMNSWSSNTIKTYNPYIKEWALYCHDRNIPMDVAMSDINLGINFLTYLFRVKKLGYSAVNNARSALSAFIVTPNSESFGSQPLVIRLLKGMFREKPALPRYAVIHDVN